MNFSFVFYPRFFDLTRQPFNIYACLKIETRLFFYLFFVELASLLSSFSVWTKSKEQSTFQDQRSDVDHDLVRRCRSDERKAQFELYEKYKNWVFNIAWHMANDQHEAEELTQMVFVRVFNKIKSFRGDSAFSSWLYRIAVNVCLNYFRKENKRRKMISNELSSLENQNASFLVGEEGKPNLKPFLEKAIGLLPEGYRMVFVLYDVEGYSHKEISTILKISEGTSKSQLHKARKELRQYLRPYVALYDSY